MVAPTQVRCPRCSTLVEKPAVGNPVCPNCGFGSPAGAATRQAPQAGYAAPAAPTGATQANAPGAVGSLVCGILAIVMLGILTGIPAVVMGGRAKRRIRESGGRLGGDGMATAGLVLGWVSIGLTLLVVLFYAAVIAAVAGAA